MMKFLPQLAGVLQNIAMQGSEALPNLPELKLGLEGDLVGLRLENLAGHTPGSAKLDNHVSITVDQFLDVIVVSIQHLDPL